MSVRILARCGERRGWRSVRWRPVEVEVGGKAEVILDEDIIDDLSTETAFHKILWRHAPAE